MPPESDSTGSPEEWLRYAQSDLELARLPPPPGVLLENLCYHAYQAAEKALKAVVLARGMPLPRTHSIGMLLDLLPEGTAVPRELEDAASLTDYAVTSRYPTATEPVDEQQHREAVRLTEAVVSWAESAVRH